VHADVFRFPAQKVPEFGGIGTVRVCSSLTIQVACIH
jgi:hypothetical protein